MTYVKIYRYEYIRDFEFWGSNAISMRDLINEKYPEKWDEIEAIIDELYPEGLTETVLNDIFAYDDDFFQKMGIE